MMGKLHILLPALDGGISGDLGVESVIGKVRELSRDVIPEPDL